MIELIVFPVGKGRYSAHLRGRCMIASAREPFLAAARVLLAEGVDPETVLIMRHAGSSIVALKSTVGAAAKLVVKDDKSGVPRFAPFLNGLESTAEPSPIEFGEVAATTLAPWPEEVA